jgi:hypothetical protein
VEADEGVEDEEAGLDVRQGQLESLLVLVEVEAELGRGDEADGEPLEVGDAAGGNRSGGRVARG